MPLFCRKFSRSLEGRKDEYRLPVIGIYVQWTVYRLSCVLEPFRLPVAVLGIVGHPEMTDLSSSSSSALHVEKFHFCISSSFLYELYHIPAMLPLCYGWLFLLLHLMLSEWRTKKALGLGKKSVKQGSVFGMLLNNSAISLLFDTVLSSELMEV